MAALILIAHSLNFLKMKQFLISIHLVGALFFTYTTAQAQNYTVPTFNYRIEKDIVYGSAVNYAGCPTSLDMDLYKPLGDGNTCRPLLVLVHGGAFVVGTKEDGNMVSLAREMASRGYVVASINYRLGWHTNIAVNTTACDPDEGVGPVRALPYKDYVPGSWKISAQPNTGNTAFDALIRALHHDMESRKVNPTPNGKKLSPEANGTLDVKQAQQNVINVNLSIAYTDDAGASQTFQKNTYIHTDSGYEAE